MRRWWKTVGVLAGSALSIGGWLSSASAQFPPPGGGMGMPPGGGMMPPPGMMPPGGGMMPPPGMMPPGGGMMPPPGMMPPGGGMMRPPGMLTSGGGAPGGMMPAEFPNAPQPPSEPASPFSFKDEGIPNAFSEFHDPRPRVNEPYVFTIKTEYLGWSITKGPISADLVTTTTNTTGSEVGALGQPSTQILLGAGNGAIDYHLTQGFRVSMGFAIGYLPPMEISGFAINRNQSVFSGGSTNATGQYLARPIQLADQPSTAISGTESAEFVNVPTIAAGSINIVSRLSLWGVEANALLDLGSSGTMQSSFILGYRHADLYEALEISNSITGITSGVNFGNTTFPLGYSTSVLDRFRTRNGFDGAQIGLRSIINGGKFSLFTDLKLAMGVSNESLMIEGASSLNNAVAGRSGTSTNGGILALPSNSGTNSRQEFAIIPEANLTLSYQINPHLRLFGGYTVMYWSNVIRPGDYISNVVDSRQIPTDANFNPNVHPTTPSFPTFVTRSLLANGFNIGIEFGF